MIIYKIEITAVHFRLVIKTINTVINIEPNYILTF